MPRNKVSDPITDQEIAFARLILSGTMTDRQAAETAGLNPDSAAYTKSKPHVRAYMLEHRAAVDLSRRAVEQQLVQQEVDGLRRLRLDREQVLDRLWEIANLSPDMTRGSINGQVKALSMIIAMENFIPNRHAVSSEKKSAPPPTAQIYKSEWLRNNQAATINPQPDPAPTPQKDSPGGPLPDHGRSPSSFANRVSSSEAPPPPPSVPLFNSVPDLGVGFPTIKNPFVNPR